MGRSRGGLTTKLHLLGEGRDFRLRGLEPVIELRAEFRLGFAVDFQVAELFHADQILTSKPLTDLYLLALAVVNKGRLATFDRAIPVSAVAGAQASNLTVL